MSLIHFLIQFYKDFKKHAKHQMIEKVNLFLKILNYYIIISKKEKKSRAESYIMSPDWILSKKATISPKREKDNKCFHWSIISGLNYNKIKEKELKMILKFKRVDTDFLSHQGDWEEFEQNNTLIALNILLIIP